MEGIAHVHNRRVAAFVTCFDTRQHLDSTPQLVVVGLVRVEVNQLVAQGPCIEYPVDEVHHGRCRAVGDIQSIGDSVGLAVQPVNCGVEQPRFGAAKTVDGLFVVPYQKNTAPVPLSVAGELLQERADQVPLGGVGILEFVDEDVFQGLIQFVLHPQHVIGPGQQFMGLPFQISEVQLALLALDVLIELQQPRSRHIPGAGQIERGQTGLAFMDF